MTLEIRTAGPMLTVQDRGRFGLRRFGVSTAGPVDARAMALANALCGNPPDRAVLEFAGFGGSFTADRSVCFAVTGGACDIRIGTRPAAAGESHLLKAGEVLKVGALSSSTWGYIAVSGGIATAPVMGSRSTHLRSTLGGLDGRALRAGDTLPLGDSAGPSLLRPSGASQTDAFPDTSPIRVVLGPQHDAFSGEILDRLLGTPFTVTPQRDRMAMLLDGPSLPARHAHDIVSDATVPGAIQVPGSGRPIVLLAECQTTGGYPKIATVIGADLPRLAQMPAGTSLRFAAVPQDQAEEIAVAQRAAEAALLDGLVAKPADLLSSEYLLSCDLVGGIFDPAQITGQDRPAANDPATGPARAERTAK